MNSFLKYIHKWNLEESDSWFVTPKYQGSNATITESIIWEYHLRPSVEKCIGSSKPPPPTPTQQHFYSELFVRPLIIKHKNITFNFAPIKRRKNLHLELPMNVFGTGTTCGRIRPWK